MSDLFADGWDSILAFKQNGTLQRFTLQSGNYYAGPFPFTFLKKVRVDVIVYLIKPYSDEIGF